MVNARILLRRDTSTNWYQASLILNLGEPGIETDTGRMKIGDGSRTWADLPYYSMNDVNYPLKVGKVEFDDASNLILQNISWIAHNGAEIVKVSLFENVPGGTRSLLFNTTTTYGSLNTSYTVGYNNFYLFRLYSVEFRDSSEKLIGVSNIQYVPTFSVSMSSPTFNSFRQLQTNLTWSGPVIRNTVFQIQQKLGTAYTTIGSTNVVSISPGTSLRALSTQTGTLFQNAGTYRVRFVYQADLDISFESSDVIFNAPTLSLTFIGNALYLQNTSLSSSLTGPSSITFTKNGTNPTTVSSISFSSQELYTAQDIRYNDEFQVSSITFSDGTIYTTAIASARFLRKLESVSVSFIADKFINERFDVFGDITSVTRKIFLSTNPSASLTTSTISITNPLPSGSITYSNPNADVSAGGTFSFSTYYGQSFIIEYSFGTSATLPRAAQSFSGTLAFGNGDAIFNVVQQTTRPFQPTWTGPALSNIHIRLYRTDDSSVAVAVGGSYSLTGSVGSSIGTSPNISSNNISTATVASTDSSPFLDYNTATTKYYYTFRYYANSTLDSGALLGTKIVRYTYTPIVLNRFVDTKKVNITLDIRNGLEVGLATSPAVIRIYNVTSSNAIVYTTNVSSASTSSLQLTMSANSFSYNSSYKVGISFPAYPLIGEFPSATKKFEFINPSVSFLTAPYRNTGSPFYAFTVNTNDSDGGPSIYNASTASNGVQVSVSLINASDNVVATPVSGSSYRLQVKTTTGAHLVCTSNPVQYDPVIATTGISFLNNNNTTAQVSIVLRDDKKPINHKLRIERSLIGVSSWTTLENIDPNYITSAWSGTYTYVNLASGDTTYKRDITLTGSNRFQIGYQYRARLTFQIDNDPPPQISATLYEYTEQTANNGSYDYDATSSVTYVNTTFVNGISNQVDGNIYYTINWKGYYTLATLLLFRNNALSGTAFYSQNITLTNSRTLSSQQSGTITGLSLTPSTTYYAAVVFSTGASTYLSSDGFSTNNGGTSNGVLFDPTTLSINSVAFGDGSPLARNIVRLSLSWNGATANNIPITVKRTTSSGSITTFTLSQLLPNPLIIDSSTNSIDITQRSVSYYSGGTYRFTFNMPYGSDVSIDSLLTRATITGLSTSKFQDIPGNNGALVMNVSVSDHDSQVVNIFYEVHQYDSVGKSGDTVVFFSTHQTPSSSAATFNSQIVIPSSKFKIKKYYDVLFDNADLASATLDVLFGTPKQYLPIGYDMIVVAGMNNASGVDDALSVYPTTRGAISSSGTSPDYESTGALSSAPTYGIVDFPEYSYSEMAGPVIDINGNTVQKYNFNGPNDDDTLTSFVASQGTNGISYTITGYSSTGLNVNNVSGLKLGQRVRIQLQFTIPIISLRNQGGVSYVYVPNTYRLKAGMSIRINGVPNSLLSTDPTNNNNQYTLATVDAVNKRITLTGVSFPSSTNATVRMNMYFTFSVGGLTNLEPYYISSIDSRTSAYKIGLNNIDGTPVSIRSSASNIEFPFPLLVHTGVSFGYDVANIYAKSASLLQSSRKLVVLDVSSPEAPLSDWDPSGVNNKYSLMSSSIENLAGLTNYIQNDRVNSPIYVNNSTSNISTVNTSPPYLGCVVRAQHFNPTSSNYNPYINELISNSLKIVVFENDTKPNSIHPRNLGNISQGVSGTFQFSDILNWKDSDYNIGFDRRDYTFYEEAAFVGDASDGTARSTLNAIKAIRNLNVKLKIHVLSYYANVPSWLANSFSKKQAIFALMRHSYQIVKFFSTNYPGLVDSYDVANEHFDSDNGNNAGGRDASGEQIFSPYMNKKANGMPDDTDYDYIIAVIIAAYAADPTVKLYYADYNCENIQSNKYTAIRDLLTNCIKKYYEYTGESLPLYGVAFQGHISIEHYVSGSNDSSKYFDNLVRCADRYYDANNAANFLASDGQSYPRLLARTRAFKNLAQNYVVGGRSAFPGRTLNISFGEFDIASRYNTAPSTNLAGTDYSLLGRLTTGSTAAYNSGAISSIGLPPGGLDWPDSFYNAQSYIFNSLMNFLRTAITNDENIDSYMLCWGLGDNSENSWLNRSNVVYSPNMLYLDAFSYPIVSYKKPALDFRNIITPLYSAPVASYTSNRVRLITWAGNDLNSRQTASTFSSMISSILTSLKSVNGISVSDVYALIANLEYGHTGRLLMRGLITNYNLNRTIDLISQSVPNTDIERRGISTLGLTSMDSNFLYSLFQTTAADSIQNPSNSFSARSQRLLALRFINAYNVYNSVAKYSNENSTPTPPGYLKYLTRSAGPLHLLTFDAQSNSYDISDNLVGYMITFNIKRNGSSITNQLYILLTEYYSTDKDISTDSVYTDLSCIIPYYNTLTRIRPNKSIAITIGANSVNAFVFPCNYSYKDAYLIDAAKNQPTKYLTNIQTATTSIDLYDLFNTITLSNDNPLNHAIQGLRYSASSNSFTLTSTSSFIPPIFLLNLYDIVYISNAEWSRYTLNTLNTNTQITRTLTITASNPSIGISSVTNLIVGQRVRFSTSVGGFLSTTNYFISNLGTTTIQLSDDKDDSFVSPRTNLITPISNGSSSATIYPVEWALDSLINTAPNANAFITSSANYGKTLVYAGVCPTPISTGETSGIQTVSASYFLNAGMATNGIALRNSPMTRLVSGSFDPPPTWNFSAANKNGFLYSTITSNSDAIYFYSASDYNSRSLTGGSSGPYNSDTNGLQFSGICEDGASSRDIISPKVLSTGQYLNVLCSQRRFFVLYNTGTAVSIRLQNMSENVSYKVYYRISVRPDTTTKHRVPGDTTIPQANRLTSSGLDMYLTNPFPVNMYRYSPFGGSSSIEKYGGHDLYFGIGTTTSADIYMHKTASDMWDGSWRQMSFTFTIPSGKLVSNSSYLQFGPLPTTRAGSSSSEYIDTCFNIADIQVEINN